jgi:hypothetical protein
MKIALTLLSLAITTASATAQDTLADPYKYYREMVKPYYAKTTPADPNAPPPPEQPAAGPNFTRTPLLTPSNNSNNNSLLDGCVISAVGRLPKADGLRVTNTSTEFRSSWRKYEFYNVLISADLNGRNGAYQWTCRIYDNISAQLLENR